MGVKKEMMSTEKALMVDPSVLWIIMIPSSLGAVTMTSDCQVPTTENI